MEIRLSPIADIRKMTKQPTIGLELVCVVLLASCGQAKSDADDTVTIELPRPTTVAERGEEPLGVVERLPNEADADNSQGDVKPVELREVARSGYTSLEPARCKLLEDRTANGETRWRCEGAAGYSLETSATDPQQLAIIGPDGNRSALDLSRIATNGTFGKLAEWRRHKSGQPRALIVRVSAAAQPKVSSLVVAKLDAPYCIVAVIPRGPRQNEKARTIADGKQLKCIVS